MERALFDSRQSAAEKDKKIAHLEAKIGSTDTRGSQIFSPREDVPREGVGLSRLLCV